MGGQVNVRLGDDDDADLTRCAAERGVERATLAKSFVRECLDAWREGRAVFDRPEQLGPGDVVAFGARLDKAVMEIDRIAQAWAAHESDMHRLEREDQLALTRARTEFIKGMPERITASFNPIRAEICCPSRSIRVAGRTTRGRTAGSPGSRDSARSRRSACFVPAPWPTQRRRSLPRSNAARTYPPRSSRRAYTARTRCLPPASASRVRLPTCSGARPACWLRTRASISRRSALSVGRSQAALAVGGARVVMRLPGLA